MATMDCKLGVTFAKRFPNGTVKLTVSEDDREWFDSSKFTVSGWDYPMLITKGATGTGEGIVESTSVARAILAKHGFDVPADVRVHRIDQLDTYNVSHDNLIIPESMIPEFPVENNYNLTLAAYKLGLKQASDRQTLTETVVTCIEEGTRKSSMFLVDTEDQFFFSGTKYKSSTHGQPLFFCEDGKYRTATQELIRRNRLGATFGAPDVLFRRTTTNKFDLRKSAVAVFRAERKAGR